MELELKDFNPEYNTLKVEAYYSKGGINYFNYKDEPRGMYVRVSAVNIKYERGFRSESFMVGGNDVGSFKFLVLPMKRNSKKKVGEFNNLLNEKLPGDDIIKMFKAGDKKMIVDVISLALGLEVLVAA